MPRCARLKSFDSVYHIMVRSISDTPLFKSDVDRDKYLDLIRKYQIIYLFKVYAYCIMTTHAHIIIDAARLCLRGFDLIREKEEYKNIVRDFLEKKVS